MNSIYDATDPIWFKFYKTLPIEDKLELQRQAENTVLEFNPIQIKYNQLLNKEISNGFPLLKKVFEEDFRNGSLYSCFKDHEEFNFEYLKELIISLRNGKNGFNFQNITINLVENKNEFNFKSIKYYTYNTLVFFEKIIGFVCFKDELIHKEWSEDNINKKIRKKILKVLITKRNLSDLGNWARTGIVNVSQTVHLQFNKVFSDKTLIKSLVYMIYQTVKQN